MDGNPSATASENMKEERNKKKEEGSKEEAQAMQATKHSTEKGKNTERAEAVFKTEPEAKFD
ncbi:hypothetical protein BG015_001276, partial [Linnemannia schmuckeri]